MAEDYTNYNNGSSEMFKLVDADKPNYIKVVGVGGGGGNAATNATSATKSNTYPT